MAKVKVGTTDTCATCGRPIEWAAAPSVFDDEGNDVTPYYKREPRWVDTDPPGEDVWNTYCNFEQRVGSHKPKTHCKVMQSNGEPCFAKVREPVTASDGSKLFVCGKHAANHLTSYEHKLEMEEVKQMDAWQQQSTEHCIMEVQHRGIRSYADGAMPSYVQTANSDWRFVNIRDLASRLWQQEWRITEMRAEINRLREEVKNATERAGNGKPEGQQDLVHVSV